MQSDNALCNQREGDRKDVLCISVQQAMLSKHSQQILISNVKEWLQKMAKIFSPTCWLVFCTFTINFGIISSTGLWTSLFK